MISKARATALVIPDCSNGTLTSGPSPLFNKQKGSGPLLRFVEQMSFRDRCDRGLQAKLNLSVTALS